MLSRQDKARIFRERFFGRQDVYGRRWESAHKDGNTFSGYAPVCSNFWKEPCGLRTKTSGCDGCPAKNYATVDDESVLKHIEGKESQLAYVLQLDGTIHFGALDFDRKMKPGKEHMDYQWEDVHRVHSLLDEWGIPHALATSTGHGWHCYMFFDGAYPANRFRAVMVEIFERVGFMEQMRLGVRPLCETFPKQSYVSPDGIGNGIKPPCIEPSWPNGKNGFITGDGSFIPIEHQWEYLDNLPRIKAEQFDALIERFAIPVYEDSMPSGTTSCGAPTLGGARSGKWQPSLSGSVEKVMAACPAFRRIRDKALAGEVLGHHEGFALYRMAMATADGLQWFTKHVKGWGTDAGQLKQLEHSLKKNYAPDTCKKLQESGVCVPGTKCLQRRPPIDQVEGQTVIRDDLPESQWPEPSPIRFSRGGGEDFLEQLKHETEALKGETNRDQMLLALESLFTRVQVFDEEQQKEYKAFVRGLKLVKPGEFSKLYAQAADTAQKEIEKNAGARSDMILTHGNWYKKLTPFGYANTKIQRNKPPKETMLCMVDINVQEERTYVDDGRVMKTVFAGTCAGPGVEKSFEISHDAWFENADFGKYFLATLGNVFNVQRQNIDAIRQAALAFSQQAGITKSSHLVTQGWYGQAYLMPSVIVDKDGVRPNTEQQVTLTGKEHAKRLDFALLSDSVFNETMLHIKKDLLNAWPRYWMTFGIAHTLLPAILRPLGLNQKRPTLFYEGLTGSGKTEITHILQQFWGEFSSPLNMLSSAKGVMTESYHFKDALLVVDDYKGISKYQVDMLKEVIQYSYDGTTSAKLNRDSSQQKERNSRATLMMSGEHFLASEASAIARTILLEVDKYNTTKTRDAYHASWKMAPNYKGITPRFIHWFLNQDLSKMRGLVDKYNADLQARSTGKQNSARIALNFSLSFLAWNLWVQFMADSNVVDRKECEDLIAEHWGYILNIQDSMLGRCEEEQSALVFMRVLRQLIASKEVSIQGLEGHFDKNKMLIGFVSPGTKDQVNLFPDVTFNTVKSFAREPGIAGNERSIAKQLADLNILCASDPSRLRKLVRFGDIRSRVWAVRLSELGFEVKAEVVDPTKPPQLLTLPSPQMDENGIF